MQALGATLRGPDVRGPLRWRRLAAAARRGFMGRRGSDTGYSLANRNAGIEKGRLGRAAVTAQGERQFARLEAAQRCAPSCWQLLPWRSAH